MSLAKIGGKKAWFRQTIYLSHTIFPGKDGQLVESEELRKRFGRLTRSLSVVASNQKKINGGSTKKRFPTVTPSSQQRRFNPFNKPPASDEETAPQSQKDKSKPASRWGH